MLLCYYPLIFAFSPHGVRPRGQGMPFFKQGRALEHYRTKHCGGRCRSSYSAGEPTGGRRRTHREEEDDEQLSADDADEEQARPQRWEQEVRGERPPAPLRLGTRDARDLRSVPVQESSRRPPREQHHHHQHQHRRDRRDERRHVVRADEEFAAYDEHEVERYDDEAEEEEEPRHMQYARTTLVHP